MRENHSDWCNKLSAICSENNLDSIGAQKYKRKIREMEWERERENVTKSTEIDIERNRRLFNDSKKGVVHYDIYTF